MEAVLVVGGNRGNVGRTTALVAELLERRAGAITARSKIYRSAAWGFRADDFYNCAFVVETTLEAEALLDTLQDIERLAGRDREAEQAEKRRTGERYASRTADIDIIFYGDEVIDTPRLTVPHPLFRQRMFVLEPLCEIIPDKADPASGRSVRELYNELKGSNKGSNR